MELIRPLTSQERSELATRLGTTPKGIDVVRHVGGAVMVVHNGERGPVFASEDKLRETLHVRG